MGQCLGRHHRQSLLTPNEEIGASRDEIELRVEASNEGLDTDVSSQLRRAAAEHDLKGIKSCIDKNADPRECDANGMNALHHACQLKVIKDEEHIKEVLSLLLRTRGCDEKINDADKDGHTALLHAIKHGNSSAAITLIDHQADFKSRVKETGNTAFHEACLAGLFNVVEKMFQKAPARSNLVKWEGHCNITPLHAACKCSHLKIVEKLIEKGADITATDDDGNTPLHAASGEKSKGSVEIIDFLLKHGAMVNLKTKNNEIKTPLSTACFYGHHEIVKFLLDKGATIDKSCMMYAVEKGYSYTARALLRSPEWRECLRQTLSSGEPIMNDIIRKMPEVATDVLDKCTVQCEEKSNKEGHVAFDFEFLECFNEAGSANDVQSVKEEFKDVIKQRKHSFSPQWGPKQFKMSHHPLAVIIDSGNCHLLTHPVVQALLYYKWKYYGLGYYLMNLIIFLLFLIFATSYSLTVAMPLSQECPAQGNGTCTIPEFKQSCIKWAAIMAIVTAAIHLLLKLGKELILMFKVGLKDFASINILYDWMDTPSYVLIIIFASIFHYDCPCPPVWQWQVGIIGLFLAWMTLLNFADKFPVIDKYVLMFAKIIKTFVKVALTIGIPLILAFAWPFYMALYDPEVKRSPFQNAGLAIGKILSMTAGNFDYDEIFHQDSSGERDRDDELSYLPAFYILWVVFIVLMPVLLNNLLIGLAVGDIKSVKEQAQLRRHIRKVQIVLEFEQLLLKCCRIKLRTGYSEVEPKPRIKCFEPEHKSEEVLHEVFDRKQHQAGKYSGKHHLTEHHTAKSLFKHAFIRKKKCKAFGGDQSQYSDLQARLERVENLLERVAEKMQVPI